MTFDFGGWPLSARTAALSLVVIALAYLLGQLGKYIFVNRLGALARRAPGSWTDAVVQAVGRRLPFWSVLVGIYIAAGFWVLAPNIANTLDKALYVITATSLTLLAAEVLVKLIRTHGSTIDPSLPQTTITENLIRIVVVILGAAGDTQRSGPVDYADAHCTGCRRPRDRPRPAGHACESVRRLLPDGRPADSPWQLHPLVIGRGRISRRYRLAREPAPAALEQHRSHPERQALAVDRHQLPSPGARARGSRSKQASITAATSTKWNALPSRSAAT